MACSAAVEGEAAGEGDGDGDGEGEGVGSWAPATVESASVDTRSESGRRRWSIVLFMEVRNLWGFMGIREIAWYWKGG